MRVIKFRAKPCCMGGKQKAWVYGTFQYIAQRRVSPGAADNGTLEARQDKGRITDLYGIETEVMCDTVCQFTGLTDKDIRRIYEGDILESGDAIHVVVYDKEEGASKQIFGKLGHLQEQLVALGIRWTPGRVNVLIA